MRLNNHLRIAIDGESASGKSYASKIIGKKYKCYILNSGLAYRYASHLIIKNNPKKVIPFLKKKFKKLNYKKLTKINLHSEKISSHVATLATIKNVRKIIKMWQRKIVLKNNRILVEGRDSATVILKKNPKFDIAFYFDCSLKKSAFRRYVDLKKKIPLKKVLQNLRNRRLKDRTRKHSALKKHKKAVLIRSDFLSKQKVILKMAWEIDRIIKKIEN
tara:strand:- start:2157 stop:2807 length:651 start_codon:yes stop_codon:yes gene_type:complete